MITDTTGKLARATVREAEFNPALSYLHPYLNKQWYGVDLLHIWYDPSDIFDEVARRTALIGKSTVDEKTGLHKLDLMAMTEDEKNDYFRQAMIDAHSQVFENLKAFTHGLRGEVMRYRDFKTGGRMVGVYDPDRTYRIGDVVEHNARLYECVTEGGSDIDADFFETPSFCIAEYWIERKQWFNPNAEPMLDNAVRECLVEYVMYSWFEMTYPKQAEVYLNKFNMRMEKLLDAVNSQEKPIRRRFRLF